MGEAREVPGAPGDVSLAAGGGGGDLSGLPAIPCDRGRLGESCLWPTQVTLRSIGSLSSPQTVSECQEVPLDI